MVFREPIRIEMKKIKVKMNKPVYLGLSMLEISKTLMYEFWYDYIKPKYADNVKLCYIDTNSFIMHIKTEDFYKISILLIILKKDLIHQIMMMNVIDPRLKERVKKVIGLMKDELGGEKVMTEFCSLRPNTYSYLMDDGGSDKKPKGTKKCGIK